MSSQLLCSGTICDAVGTVCDAVHDTQGEFRVFDGGVWPSEDARFAKASCATQLSSDVRTTELGLSHLGTETCDGVFERDCEETTLADVPLCLAKLVLSHMGADDRLREVLVAGGSGLCGRSNVREDGLGRGGSKGRGEGERACINATWRADTHRGRGVGWVSRGDIFPAGGHQCMLQLLQTESMKIYERCCFQ